MSPQRTDSAPAGDDAGERLRYVTVAVAGQWFGIPIERVHDVFVTGALTPVPLAPPDVAGLVNLRGRVITAIDLRRRLGLPAPGRGAAPGTADGPAGSRMAVGIAAGAEHYGLLVDEVGDVLSLERDSRDDAPSHLAGAWSELTTGVHRLHDHLLLALDVDRALHLRRTPPPDPGRKDPCP